MSEGWPLPPDPGTVVPHADPGTRASRPAIERAVADLIRALGEDPHAPHLRHTPGRVARLLEEETTQTPVRITALEDDIGYDGLVTTHGITFGALCACHVARLRGVAHICYLPGDRLVGLSKLARVLESCLRGLVVPERLAGTVAACLEERLDAAGVGVVLDMQLACRPGSTDTRVVTTALRGALREPGEARTTFLMQLGVGDGNGARPGGG